MLAVLFAAIMPSRRGASGSTAPKGTDEESVLLERMSRADAAALKALYDRLAPTCLGVAVRILGSRPEAEDALQDGFIDVWKRCGQFDPMRGSARTWIIAIVRNRAIDRIRSRTATSRMTSRAEGEAEVGSGTPSGPLEHAEQREAHSQIHTALDELSADQRRAVELAYFEGLSQTEIAAKLDEPLGTIKTRVRAAIDKLARLLPSERGHS